MFPFFRFFLAMIRQLGKPRLGPDETFTTYHWIMPWDIDVFGELNNGRTLTIFDLNRLPFGLRTGLVDVIRKKGWAMTMAGVSVRFRKRIKMFNRVRITCRVVGRDERFFYMNQTMWLGDEPAHNALYRGVVYSKKDGIVPTQEIGEALEQPDWAPDMPQWVQNWIDAEATRAWPPEN